MRQPKNHPQDPLLITNPHKVGMVDLEALQPVIGQLLDVLRTKRLPPVTAVIVLEAALIHVCQQFRFNPEVLFKLYPMLLRYMRTRRFVRPYLSQQGGWDALSKRPLGGF